MGDNDPAAVLRAVASLGDRGIPFDGSIVAMPHLVGWEDLRQTIAFLARWGAETIRIFLPGYTRYTRREWLPPAGMEEKLRAFVAEEGERSRVPLILELPFLEDLTPRILGVIVDSPADRAGLRRGDIVTAINGKEPFSRVDAFRQVQKAGRAVIDLNRDGAALQVSLEKEEGASPALSWPPTWSRPFSIPLPGGCGRWSRTGPWWPPQPWRHPFWPRPWIGFRRSFLPWR